MIKVVKVVCFDALLQVLILKGVTKGSGEWPLEDRGKQVATCKEGICHPDQVGAGAGTESTEKDRNAILEAATKVRSGEWNPSHNALKARKSLEVLILDGSGTEVPPTRVFWEKRLQVVENKRRESQKEG